MQDNLKILTYKLILKIHTIHISVKFPCFVQLSVRTDSKDAQLKKEFKLNNGNARIQQSVTVELKLVFNSQTKQFVENKVNVIIFLKSSTSRIPAGSATIPIKSDRQQVLAKSRIEKCPDKNASIDYSVKMVLVKEQNHFEDSFRSKSVTKMPQPSLILPITTISNNIQRKRLKTQIQTSRATSDHKKFQLIDKIQREKSEVGSQFSSSQSRISQMIIKQQENEVNSQRQKILQLEKQKSKAMREIRALKHEIEANAFKNSIMSSDEDKGIIAKHQSRIYMLQDQIEKQKNKVSQLQIQSHKRKLKIQELEKDMKSLQRKNEQMEDQVKKFNAEKEIIQTKNKQLSSELKEMRQKYEDQLLAHENYIKRAQFKENVYKQQLKNMNDKYAASENEKQKLLFERNELLNEYEEKDKKEMENLRNRQRASTEEKNKLIRKVDSLEKKFASKSQEKDALEQQLLELQTINKKNKSIIDAHQLTIEQYSDKITTLKAQVMKQREIIKSLEDQVQHLQKIDEEKKNLKKLLTQKEYELAKFTQSKFNLQSTKKSLSQKTQELQSQLKQKTTTLKVLQKQYENLSKKYETLKKSQEQKTKQISEINLMRQNEESKICDLSEELKQLNKRYRQLQQEANKEIENLKNYNIELDEENHDTNEKLFIINQKLFENEQETDDLKAKYQQKLAENEKISKELAVNLEKIQSFNVLVQELTFNKKENQYKYEGQLDIAKKTIKQLQTQVKEYHHKFEKITKNNEQNSHNLNSQLKTYQIQAMNKDKELHQLRIVREENEAQINSLTTQLQQTTIQVGLKSKELASFKEDMRVILQEKAQIQSHIKDYQFQIKNLKAETKLLEKSIETVNKEKEQLEEEVKKAIIQLDKFKANNQYNLKTFFNILWQPDIPEVVNLLHDDAEVIKFMSDALNKKKSIIVESKKSIQELKIVNFELQSNVQELKAQIQCQNEKIEELNQMLAQKQQNMMRLEQQMDKIKVNSQKNSNGHTVRVANLQKQIDNYKIVENNLNEVINRKIQEINMIKKQNTELKLNVEGLEQKIQKLNRTSQGELQKITDNSTLLKSQLHKFKTELQQEQIKLKSMQAANNQTITANKELQQKVEQLEKQNKSIIESKHSLKNQIENLNVVIKAKNEELKIAAQNSGSISTELESTNEQIKTLRQKIINLEIVKKGLAQKSQKLEQKVRQLGEEIKNKEKTIEEQKKLYDQQTKRMKKQLQNEKRVKDNLQIRIKELENQIVEIERKLKQAYQQVNSTKMQVSTLSNESAGQKQKYVKENEILTKKLEENNKNMDQQIMELKNQLQKVTVERDFLSQNILNMQKSMEEMMVQKRKSQEKANQKISALQKQNGNLAEQLANNKQQLTNLQSSFTQLARNFQNFQIRNDNEAKYMKPIAQKLNHLLTDSDEYSRFMNHFETNKTKLMKISNSKLENYIQKPTGEIVREINIAAQRCKLQIMNKFKIPQENKTAVVEEFKTLQGSIEKIIKF